MSTTSKIVLRHELKAKREMTTVEYKADCATKICSRIENLDVYKKAERIALYQAIKNEVSLHPLWHSALKQGKICYFPFLNNDLTLSFFPADKDTAWTINQFGIAEPSFANTRAVNPEKLDIIFIPLLGFDKNGTRIGMGAGYYDRTLANKKLNWLAGIAYEFQLVPFIHPDPWDVPMDLVITEQTIYWSNL